MSLRSHYVVLGVRPEEGESGIRAAFRDLARRYHPDHVGAGGAQGFAEIAEAFHVLGDPVSRRSYDDRQRDDRAGLESPEDGPHGLAQAAMVEPLIPDGTSLRRGSDASGPTDAIVARFARNFSGLGVPKAERLEPLHVRVTIAPEEAATGTTLTLGLPTFERCGDCNGLGRSLLLQCLACAGEGLVEIERPVRLDVPPLSGTEVKLAVPLDGLGIHNFFVILHVAIDPLLA